MITRDMLERYCAQAGLTIEPSHRLPKDDYRHIYEIDIDRWVFARYNALRIPSIEVWFGDSWKDIHPQTTAELGRMFQAAIDDLLDRNTKTGLSPIRIAMTRELLTQAGSEIVGV